MAEWTNVNTLEDLPDKDGEYLVVLHRIVDFFGEPAEKEQVTSAFYHYEQKTWEITSDYYINALLPIFEIYDTFTTDYIDYWMSMPEVPNGG